MVDLWVGDGCWAMANLKNQKPKPYVGFNMCVLQTKCVTNVCQGQIKKSIALAGHDFCIEDNRELIEELFHEVIDKVDNPQDPELPQEDDDEDEPEAEDPEDP